ncbi:MAG: hypothetical protein SFV21_07395 [Rhodospirillaceae bacterium]|nr:hypothetical protein [Rhodospirillaceae bacterium]
MVVAIDTSGFSQTVAPSPPPYVRAPQADPTAAHQRPRRDGREADVGGERKAQTFKSVLDAANGPAPISFGGQADTGTKTAAVARPDKIPQRGPAELSADDGQTIYVETQSRQSRPDAARASTAVLAAVANYAERVLAASNTFAARGDNLELTA